MGIILGESSGNIRRAGRGDAVGFVFKWLKQREELYLILRPGARIVTGDRWCLRMFHGLTQTCGVVFLESIYFEKSTYY